MNFHGFDVYLSEDKLQGKQAALKVVTFRRPALLRLVFVRVVLLRRYAQCCFKIRPRSIDQGENDNTRISGKVSQELLG